MSMPRLNRSDYLYDGCVVHARLQINNGEFLFSTDQHFKLWEEITLRYLKKYPTVTMSGYIWMSNHCHMTLETDKALDISKFMHDMAWRYAKEFNKMHHRKGHLFQQRFRCSVIDKDEYEKIAKRYIYRNQVRAGMVQHVKQTKWSSYHYYAYGKPDPLITPFRTFNSFGVTKKIRMLEFRKFVEEMMGQEEFEWKMRLSNPFLKTKKEKMREYFYKSGMG